MRLHVGIMRGTKRHSSSEGDAPKDGALYTTPINFLHDTI